MLLYLIKLSLSRGELNLALGFAEEQPSESKHFGYREILDFYAENAQLKEFKKYLKLSKPGKAPRNTISDSKSKFIANYSQANGIEKGIEILREKIFGWKYCKSVIENRAEQFTLKEIDQLLIKHPEFYEQDEYIKQYLYVQHYSNQISSVPIIEEKEFVQLIELIMGMDKKVRFGDGRYRDGLLCDLGASVNNLNQIKECKKNIIDPFYKRELNYHIKRLKENLQIN